MKRVSLEVTWRSTHSFEVEDEWRVPNTLDGFTQEQLEEMTSQNAELVDWEATSELVGWGR